MRTLNAIERRPQKPKNRLQITMRLISLALLTSAFAKAALGVGVTGAAEGFAKGVTGGGSASPVYPTTNEELVSYLGDSSPRVIILTKTFDFRGTEGTASGTGCAPWGTGSGCQTAIDQNGWCTSYQPNAPKVSVSYDKAGVLGITVKSNKSLVGQGSSGGIIGKGLRIVSGASNVIIQNIKITNINPQYVWGGDAITLDNTDLVWIDHVTVRVHDHLAGTDILENIQCKTSFQANNLSPRRLLLAANTSC